MGACGKGGRKGRDVREGNVGRSQVYWVFGLVVEGIGLLIGEEGWMEKVSYLPMGMVMGDLCVGEELGG